LKKKKTNFCFLVGTIIIVLLLVLIAMIGFRPDGFASKVLMSKTSKTDAISANCYYSESLSDSARKTNLTLDCSFSENKGYFCEDSIELKNTTFSLSKNTCGNLNTCFDGIKNQGELGIDCGGPCAPCDNLYCTQNSDCQSGNSCSSGYCDLEINQCIMSLQPNGTVCGTDKVCQFGDCADIFYDPTITACALNYVVSDPLLDIPRCSDPIREGFEFSHTDIGQQTILPWPGEGNTPPTQVLIDGAPLSENSIIGVFREDQTGLEVCEGFVYWSDNISDQNALYVSAYTPLFPTYGGMEEGEEFIWKVWDIDTNQIYHMTPTFYTLEELGLYGYSQNNFFSPDSLTVLKKLENITGCQTNSNCDDGNPCTTNTCVNGTCQTTNNQNGSSCGSGLICDDGSCITPECTSNPDCDDNNPCTNNTCTNFTCSSTPFPNNTSCGQGLVCQAGNCVAEPECSVNSDCEDDNPCTNNLCSDGECTFPPLPNNTSCGEGLVCQAGNCVAEPECTINSDCEDGEVCQNGVCILETDIEHFLADDIFIGYRNSCAIFLDNSVKCWGMNTYGQLGDGTTEHKSSPVVLNISNVSQMSLGKNHSCALLDNGTVKCWGRNNYGQLGNNSTTNSSLPVSVSNLSNVVEIALGQEHSCALLDNGTVKCWGRNNSGQLGNGTNTNSSLPVTVSSLSNVVEISLGVEHSCALLDNGTVKCWGRNEHGQLGNNSTTNKNVPVNVNNLSNISQISLGTEHSCALLNNGTVKCWGANWYGQLAIFTDPVVGIKKTPVSVNGLSNVTKLSLGHLHSCALLNNGQVKCWGNNSVGILGDGTNIYKNTIVNVSDISTATKISLGEEHSCALLEDNTIKCWGKNGSGQIGNGTTFFFNKPVPVYCFSDACCSLANEDCYSFNYNSDTFSCQFQSAPNGQSCIIGDYKSCDNGLCVYNSFLNGFLDLGCETPPVNTGTALMTHVISSALHLNNNQTVLGIAAKYVDDYGNLQCGGGRVPNSNNYNTYYVYGSTMNIALFGNDGSTPEKNGFYGGEEINFFIRTEDYLCKVNGLYLDATYYVSNQKWYPTSLAILFSFKDFTTGSTTIDFSNTDNCTYVGPINKECSYNYESSFLNPFEIGYDAAPYSKDYFVHTNSNNAIEKAVCLNNTTIKYPICDDDDEKTYQTFNCNDNPWDIDMKCENNVCVPDTSNNLCTADHQEGSQPHFIYLSNSASTFENLGNTKYLFSASPYYSGDYSNSLHCHRNNLINPYMFLEIPSYLKIKPMKDTSSSIKTGFITNEELKWRLMDTDGQIYKADPIYQTKPNFTTNNKWELFAKSNIIGWENITPVIRYYCDEDDDNYISNIFSGECFGTTCNVPSGCQLQPGNDCKRYDPDVYPGVVANISAGNDVQLCASSEYVPLNETIDGYYETIEWFTTGDGEFTNNKYYFGTQDLQNKQVTLTLKVTGCNADVTDSLTVTLVDLPTVVIDEVQNECVSSGDIIELSAQSQDHTEVRWYKGEYKSNKTPISYNLTTDYQVTSNDISDGEVLFTFYSKNECGTVLKSKTVFFFDSPTISAPNILRRCEDETFQVLFNASNYLNVEWITNGDGEITNMSSDSFSYIPGTQDLLNSGTTLQGTAYPLESCSLEPPATESVSLFIQKKPRVGQLPFPNNSYVDLINNQYVQFNLQPTDYSTLKWSVPSEQGFFTSTTNPTTRFYPYDAYKGTGLPITITITLNPKLYCSVPTVETLTFYAN
jgi:alpha-tubulin suppressor-like RCC1 family protein